MCQLKSTVNREWNREYIFSATICSSIIFTKNNNKPNYMNPLTEVIYLYNLISFLLLIFSAECGQILKYRHENFKFFHSLWCMKLMLLIIIIKAIMKIKKESLLNKFWDLFLCDKEFTAFLYAVVLSEESLFLFPHSDPMAKYFLICKHFKCLWSILNLQNSTNVF